VRLVGNAGHFAAATYPSAWSGASVSEHGLHYPFMWSASEQRVLTFGDVPAPTAMWERLAGAGVTCAVVDAYESWRPAAIDGVFVRGWQFRNRVVLRPCVVPESAVDRWRRLGQRAPRAEEVFGRPSERRLRRLAAVLTAAPARLADLVVDVVRDGAPDVLVCCLSAVHLAGHQFLDPSVVAPELEARVADELQASLRTVYVEADRALGRILDALPADADVIVFSGLDMGPDTSRTDMLAPLLDLVLGRRTASTTSASGWRTRSLVPASLRAAVADRLPDRVAIDLAARLELRGVDWTTTRAFAVPSDTTGFVRLNVRGRERDGIVDPADVPALVEEIRAGLVTFELRSGAPAVEAVDATADVVPAGPAVDALPDLVVRWSHEPTRHDERLVSPDFGLVRRSGWGSGRSGNHRSDGWALIVPGRAALGIRDGEREVTDLAATALARFGLGHRGAPLLA